uniref:AlNc14C28G2716 protein n=1 Tax=Albugo laibachii Nc14 TaxID=890382 RepID=F0W794_9STRA|nr:AlNc14C28G2716 [Albugo laibachii Nc14]|eukprot:CCA16993.1 AlNc14C28G2716 [Albugo laibachii Nc14]
MESPPVSIHSHFNVKTFPTIDPSRSFVVTSWPIQCAISCVTLTHLVTCSASCDLTVRL